MPLEHHWSLRRAHVAGPAQVREFSNFSTRASELVQQTGVMHPLAPRAMHPLEQRFGGSQSVKGSGGSRSEEVDRRSRVPGRTPPAPWATGARGTRRAMPAAVRAWYASRRQNGRTVSDGVLDGSACCLSGLAAGFQALAPADRPSRRRYTCPWPDHSASPRRTVRADIEARRETLGTFCSAAVSTREPEEYARTTARAPQPPSGSE